MIHVSKLTKYYGDYPAVQDVSFDVAKGQIVGFLGPNGAGKTTTMRILAGYLTATSGTAEIDGVKITLTNAHHSSSAFEDGKFTYLGEPAGLVIEVENGTKLYFAGDTCVFGDMQLIGRIYEPDVAILPIGDHFTMGPREAAVALELLGVRRCVPAHYGTFPLLTGTPDELRQLAPDVEVTAPQPGETVTLGKMVAV